MKLLARRLQPNLSNCIATTDEINGICFQNSVKYIFISNNMEKYIPMFFSSYDVIELSVLVFTKTKQICKKEGYALRKKSSFAYRLTSNVICST